MPAFRLHPFDLVLAIRLLEPAGTLGAIAAELAVVPSQVHAAIRRLRQAGLAHTDRRSTLHRALSEFVLAGVRYAFAAERGALVYGIPTAYSTLPLSALVDAVDVVVWPAPRLAHAVRGFAISPLYRGAPLLAERSPLTYTRLSLVDALRIGDARVRELARTEWERSLTARR